MAVQKSFVVKNGLQVATNLIYGTSDLNKVGIGSTIPSDTLDVRGGIAATDIAASGYLTAGGYITASDNLSVAGIASFSDQVNIAGVTTLASSGGITTTGGDFYVGGDLYVSDDVVYDAVSGRELYISGIGTIVDLTSTNVNVTGLVTASHGFRATAGGINVVAGVSTFANQVDANGSVDVAGIITATSGLRATAGGINIVSGVSTFANAVDANGGVDVAGIITATSGVRVTTGGLNIIAGVSTFAGLVDVNAGADLVGGLTADNINVTGVLTAASLHGGSIGLSSEGTYIGAGATQVNFASSNSTAWTVTEPSAGVATVTVTPGASIGLVLALS